MRKVICRKVGKNHGKRSKPRDCKKYNSFRKEELKLVLPAISAVVHSSGLPYGIENDGTGVPVAVGRPKADLRAIVISLLIRSFFRLSYRSVYSLLGAPQALTVTYMLSPGVMVNQGQHIHTWVYAAIAIAVVIIVAMSVVFVTRRRKRVIASVSLNASDSQIMRYLKKKGGSAI